MSAVAPWSVKGIDPKAREVAKDMARRSGMTLGEWLNTMIMEDDAFEPEPEVSARDRRGRPSSVVEGPRSFRNDTQDGSGDPQALHRIATSVDALAARLEAAERRSTVAIQGVDQAVAGLVRRLETQDDQTRTHERRIDDVAEELREGHRRLRRFEQEVGPGTTEAFAKMETSVAAVASRLYDIEERQRGSVNELRERMDKVETGRSGAAADGLVAALAQRLEKVEGRQRDGREAITSIGARLDAAQAGTTEALKSLERSFSGLDQRLGQSESRVEPEGQREAVRFEKLAESLSRQVETSRSDMMRRLDTAEAEGRIGRIERTLETLGDGLKSVEQNSAHGIETMGREVLRIAQHMTGRLQQVETAGREREAEIGTRLDRKIEGVKTDLGQSLEATIERRAQAFEHRLTRTDDQSALALEKLGSEIARISERLADRIAQSERKSAQAIEDIDRRLGQGADRAAQNYDRMSGEIAERVRQSEERTARLLDEARELVSQRTEQKQTPVTAPIPEPASPMADWRASVFPQEAFEPLDNSVDSWSDDPLSLDVEPAAFPGMIEAVLQAPVAIAPTSPHVEVADDLFEDDQDGPTNYFGDPVADSIVEPASEASRPEIMAFGGANVGDVFEATKEASLKADPTSSIEPDVKPTETFIDIAALRAGMRAGAAAGRANELSNEPDEDRTRFGLRARGGKSRLQERLDRQAQKEGSTARKAIVASGVAAVVVAGLVATIRISDGMNFTLPGLDAISGGLGLSPSVVDEIVPLAAVALTASAPAIDPKAQKAYDTALEVLDSGKAGAVTALTEAANLGHPEAQLRLARLYELGENGVETDTSEARSWIRRAAEGGDPRGMHAYGMYLYDGVGGPRNRPEALSWLKKAADRGVVDSQYNVAKIYESGDEGIVANPTEAFKWYMIAARGGDQEAQGSVDRLTPKLAASVRRAAQTEAEKFQTKPQS